MEQEKLFWNYHHHFEFWMRNFKSRVGNLDETLNKSQLLRSVTYFEFSRPWFSSFNWQKKAGTSKYIFFHVLLYPITYITLEVQTPHQILFLFGRSFVVVNVIGFQFAYIKLKSPFFLVVAGGWKHHWQERRDRETLSRRGKKLGNASIENWEAPLTVCVKLSSNDIQKLPRALHSTHLSFFKVSFLFSLLL